MINLRLSCYYVFSSSVTFEIQIVYDYPWKIAVYFKSYKLYDITYQFIPIKDIVETAEIENPAEAAEEPEVEEVHVVEAQVQEVGADVPENPEPAVEAAVEPVEEAV